MKNRQITHLLKPIAFATAQLFALSAYSADTELPQVEVIANTVLTGVGVPLTDVPSNAQVIKKKDITEQGTNNLADLLNNNLGSVSVSNGTGNGYQNDVNYRGFSATSLLGAPVGLSVYMDGIRMNEPFGSNVNWDLIPMNAISSINLLPGSNPMFGLNTLGGALVVNTKNGKDDPGTSISLLGGSFNRKALSFETGWADDAHNTDYFISGNYDKQDGYRWYSNSTVQQLYGKARWHDADTKAELSFALVDNRLNGTQALPPEMLGTPKAAYSYPDGQTNSMAFLNLKLSRTLSDGDLVTGNVYYRRSNTWSSNSNVQQDETNGYSSLAFMSPGTTGVDNFLVSPGSGVYIDTTMIYSSTHQDTVGTNLMWTNTDDKFLGHNNTFSLGTSIDYSRISYIQNTYLAHLVNYQTVIDPSYYSGNVLMGNVNVGSHNEDFSLFMTDTLDVTEKFKLTASGSINATSISMGGTNNNYLDYDGSPVNTSDPVIGSHSYHRFNPALGFSYLPSKSLNLFGGYSEAMRAPTAIELACADPAHPCTLPTGFNGDPDLKAVVAKTYELGARGLLTSNTAWNLVVYDTKLSNDIQFVQATSTTGNFANVGDTERRGLDAGVSGKYDNLFLSANYGYVDAVYRSTWNNASYDPVNNPVSVVNGNKIPGIANQTVKLRAAYEVSPTFVIGSNLILVAGQYAHGDETNQLPKVPGYGVMNLDLHYKVSDDLMLNGIVNNVLNKQYYTYGVVGTNIYTGTNGTMVTPAAPRAIWVGLTYTFGGKKLNTVDKD